MNTHKKRSVVSIGTTTIVLIFVLLCLLTFSVLSLVSAQANMRLSRKSADHTTAYYTAENTANEILAEVIQCMENHLTGANAEEFYAGVRSDLEGTHGIAFPEPSQLVWRVPVNKNQSLHVTLALSFEPLSNGEHYQIISWNTENTYPWGEDQTIPLPTDNALPEMSTEE